MPNNQWVLVLMKKGKMAQKAARHSSAQFDLILSV
jgi:hypothetical protein